MKEKIIRLKFKNRQRTRTKTDSPDGKFTTRWNVNEDDEMLDISVHREPTEVLFTDQDVDGFVGKISVTINNKNEKIAKIGEEGKIKYAEEVIKKRQKKSSTDAAGNITEAIYQFSIPFIFFTEEENIIVIYTESSPPPTQIATLEFFREVEDNFINVKLGRPDVEYTYDRLLWDAIKKNSLKFLEYEYFINKILCMDDDRVKYKDKTFSDDKSIHPNQRALSKIRSPFVRSEEYNLLKFGTEFYMLARFGLNSEFLTGYLKTSQLPYYDYVVASIKDDIIFSPGFKDNPTDCDVRLNERLVNPFMIELIWSYWMEQGMLVQTLNVINLRFQNIKGNRYVEALQRFDVDPLRPLNHILWGYIQDEQHRLSLPRRLYEYDHEYGLTLTGRAVPQITPADSRVPFLEAFHSLLNQCIFFFRESDDTTRIADAFPILNSLKEVHLLLAEGNHNAYGNLTWTARHEMMIQQYILSRPEMREFMGGKVMVPYPETWMDRVDTMRSLQGWGNTSIVYYYELAVHGEMILLSIRYGNWSDVTLDRHNAANWAQEFRNSIQRYIHAYRTVTGVDLSAEQLQIADNFAIQPSFLIQQRLLQDKQRIKRA